MALGTFGSTLNDELNRLANGGTYRTMGNMVDEALAAKQWANRENINPYSTDTVGILNEIAGLGLDKRNWLDFNGVCNYIAGTTGLPAAAALRQVYPTTDLLTGIASYYVDATAPTNWGSLGYVYLNGVNGNYLSVPDESALDITGDIDIRCRVAMDDWTPSAQTSLIAKISSATTRSYGLFLNTDGTLQLYWTTNGSTYISAISTVTPTISDGQPLWVRATLDVDNGASGNDTKFYTSTDGTTWTQLGTTVTKAGTTSIYSSTSPVEIGSSTVGLSVMAGKVYRAQILNGIGGTTVLDVNIATDFKASNEDKFTATTGQTVTVNGVDTIANLGTAGSLLPTTLGSSTAADSNDPKFLDHTGTNYVYLPGANSNNISVPDENALDITGDIDLRWYGALDDWTPAGNGALIDKRATGTTEISYDLQIRITGALALEWSANGTSTVATVLSTVATGITDGTAKWVRATLDVDNGAGGYDVKFFLSDDGTNWTQLGSTVTGVGTTSIYSGTGTLRSGSSALGNFFYAGKCYRVQVFAGLNGTDKRLDIDTSVITAGSATSFTALTGQTVSIGRATSGRKTVAVTQPTWLFGTDDYMEVNNRYMSSGTYLYLPGVASNYASAPDSAALDITGDIDLRVKVALDDWTPSAEIGLLSKFGGGGARSYLLAITNPANNSRLALYWTTDGTNTISALSSVSPTVSDGETLWVRATLDVDNGASGYNVNFYTSTDGTTWTQLGTTVTGGSTTSIFSGAASLNVGAYGGGATSPARGKFFRAQVLNGIGGTVAFDANFESSITSLNQASFTESSANAATVTINRSGSAYRSAGITTAGYLYPGATNTFSASATDFLNFGAADSFTIMAIVRQWATAPAQPYINNISQTAATGQGWYLNPVDMRIGDGTTRLIRTYTGPTAGTTATLIGVRNTAADTIYVYSNGTVSASTTDTTTGSLNWLLGATRIGATAFPTVAYQDFEGYAFAVFRTVLTAAQARQITNYFANREVYL